MSLLSQCNIFWTLFFQSPSSVRYLLSVEFRELSSVIRLKWRSELIESRAPRPPSPAALLSWITACFHIHIVGAAAREAGQRCLEEGNSCTALLERDRWGSERKAQTGQPKQAAAWCTLHAWDAARINTCSPLAKWNENFQTYQQRWWWILKKCASDGSWAGVWVQTMSKDVAVRAEQTGLIWVD